MASSAACSRWTRNVRWPSWSWRRADDGYHGFCAVAARGRRSAVPGTCSRATHPTRWTGGSGRTGWRCSDARQPGRAVARAGRTGPGAAAGAVPYRTSGGGHLAAGRPAQSVGGTTTRTRTSCRSSLGWTWWGRALPRRRPGGRGCPNQCCAAARATCWPAWRASRRRRPSRRGRGPAGSPSQAGDPVPPARLRVAATSGRTAPWSQGSGGWRSGGPHPVEMARSDPRRDAAPS